MSTIEELFHKVLREPSIVTGPTPVGDKVLASVPPSTPHIVPEKNPPLSKEQLMAHYEGQAELDEKNDKLAIKRKNRKNK